MASVNDNNLQKSEPNNAIPPNISQGYIKSEFFSGVIAAHWDNVMGPVVSKVWLGNLKVPIDWQIINYVSNQTLSGELCRQTEKHSIDPVLYVLTELGYIFFAVIFNGYVGKVESVASISFVLAYEYMENYLLMERYIHQQVKVIVLRYRVLQQKGQLVALKEFSRDLKKFVKVIDSLQEMNLKGRICLNDTVFGECEEANDFGLLDSKFLMRVITSHLQTCGCAIVTGTSAAKINLLIRTLALFLSPIERFCSKLTVEDECSVFCKDLFLQGILREKRKELGVPSKDILLSTYPVTLIDVDEKTVKQTPLLNEHATTRNDFLKIDLNFLVQGTEAPAYPLSGLFTDQFGDISIMVQHFVTELFAITNKCTVRHNHVTNFLSMLDAKRDAMLDYIEDKSNFGRSIMKQSHLQTLMRDLSYHTEADFRIVLAAVEKVRPGVAVFLLGNLYKEDATYKKHAAPAFWR